MTHEDHIAHLQNLLARCLQCVQFSAEAAEEMECWGDRDFCEGLITEIRKAVPWLKERDE